MDNTCKRHAIQYSRLIHIKSITVIANTIILLHHNYNTNNNPYSYHNYIIDKWYRKDNSIIAALYSQ